MVAGTDNALCGARPHGVKLAWRANVLFSPLTDKNQNSDILRVRQWMAPPDILNLVTHDHAVAAYAQRRVTLADGQVVSDVRLVPRQEAGVS